MYWFGTCRCAVFPAFRASHMNVPRHIDVGGTRISEIADRSRMSKQAVGQLVKSCEAQKLAKNGC